MFALPGLSLIGIAIWIFSQPAGQATIGEVRGIAGLCGLLIGTGVALIGFEIVRAADKQF